MSANTNPKNENPVSANINSQRNSKHSALFPLTMILLALTYILYFSMFGSPRAYIASIPIFVVIILGFIRVPSQIMALGSFALYCLAFVVPTLSSRIEGSDEQVIDRGYETLLFCLRNAMGFGIVGIIVNVLFLAGLILYIRFLFTGKELHIARRVSLAASIVAFLCFVGLVINVMIGAGIWTASIIALAIGCRRSRPKEETDLENDVDADGNIE